MIGVEEEKPDPTIDPDCEFYNHSPPVTLVPEIFVVDAIIFSVYRDQTFNT